MALPTPSFPGNRAARAKLRAALYYAKKRRLRRLNAVEVDGPYVGPLDDRLDATGVAGTMLFFSAYEGPAISVHNVDLDVYTDIDFDDDGLVDDAQMLAAIGESEYVNLATAYRQDDSEDHYTQTESTQRPRMVKVGGVWCFRGTSLGGGGTGLIAPLVQVQPFTRYMVLRPNVWEGFRYYADCIAAAAPDNCLFYTNGGVEPQAYIHAGEHVGTVDFPIDEWSVATNVFNGASSELRRNKEAGLVGDAGAATNLTHQAIGFQAGGTNSAGAEYMGIFNLPVADDTAAQDAIFDAIAAARPELDL